MFRRFWEELKFIWAMLTSEIEVGDPSAQIPDVDNQFKLETDANGVQRCVRAAPPERSKMVLENNPGGTGEKWYSSRQASPEDWDINDSLQVWPLYDSADFSEIGSVRYWNGSPEDTLPLGWRIYNWPYIERVK